MTYDYGLHRNRTVLSHPPTHTVRTVQKTDVTTEVSVYQGGWEHNLYPYYSSSPRSSSKASRKLTGVVDSGSARLERESPAKRAKNESTHELEGEENT